MRKEVLNRPIAGARPLRHGASGIGHWSSRAAPRRAFTLLEVLLAVALVALIGSVLVGGAVHLLREQPVTPDEVFWKAVQEARKAALKNDHAMRLRYEKDGKRFQIIDGVAPPTLNADGFTKTQPVAKELAIPAQSAGDLTVDFLPAGTKGGHLIVVGGAVIESQPISYATFYPDGTCTPFRVQFFRNGSSHILGVDPWTCAPMLNADEANR